MPRKATVRFAVYDYIRTYKEAHDGNSPTYAEITRHFGWKSDTTAWAHVAALESAGYLKIDENRRIILPGGDYVPPKAPAK